MPASSPSCSHIECKTHPEPTRNCHKWQIISELCRHIDGHNPQMPGPLTVRFMEWALGFTSLDISLLITEEGWASSPHGQEVAETSAARHQVAGWGRSPTETLGPSSLMVTLLLHQCVILWLLPQLYCAGQALAYHKHMACLQLWSVSGHPAPVPRRTGSVSRPHCIVCSALCNQVWEEGTQLCGFCQ